MGQKDTPVYSIQYLVRVVITTDREEVWPDAEGAEEGGQGVLWTVWESRDRQTGMGVQCRQGQSQRSRSVSQLSQGQSHVWPSGKTDYVQCMQVEILQQFYKKKYEALEKMSNSACSMPKPKFLTI